VPFRSAAREKILRGATQLSDAVRVTPGPKSKSVSIEKQWSTPVVCNDGVKITTEFEFEDPEENLGAPMLRQAAERTDDLVGDGTRTATIPVHNDASSRAVVDALDSQVRGYVHIDMPIDQRIMCSRRANAEPASCAPVSDGVARLQGASVGKPP
jgi:hypothetical protein